MTPQTTLAGGFKLHEQVYYYPAARAAGDARRYYERSDTGDTLEFGGKGEVMGPHKHILGKPAVDVRFPGSKGYVGCLVAELSRTPPPPPLAGGFREKEQVYFSGASQTLSTGDTLEYGGKGEVMGPSKVDPAKKVAVRFPGNTRSVPCRVTELRRTPPESSSLKKATREAAAKAKREAEEKATREAAAKAKRETEEKATREAAAKAKREAAAKAKREAEEKAKRDADERLLPGGFNVKEQVYYTGNQGQWDNGDTLEYGSKGEVTGAVPGRDDQVAVRFLGNRDDRSHACSVAELSRALPLAGGFNLNEEVFWCGASRTLSGDSVQHGAKGAVVGSHSKEPDTKVIVRFPGSRRSFGCPIAKLCRTWPPATLAGEFNLKEQVYYVGANGETLRYGAKGEVVGRSKTNPDNKLAVRFLGKDIDCFVTTLLRYRPSRRMAPQLPPKKEDDGDDGMYRFARGVSVIIANVDVAGAHSLPGYDADVAALKDVLPQINLPLFRPAQRNLSARQMVEFMRDVGVAIDRNRSIDAVMVVLMSHGAENVIAGSDGKLVQMSELYACVNRPLCRSLEGKPKIFITQKCRGHGGQQDTLPAAAASIPLQSDFLYAFAAPLGFVSWVPSSGSHYISTLVEELRSNMKKARQ